MLEQVMGELGHREDEHQVEEQLHGADPMVLGMPAGRAQVGEAWHGAMKGPIRAPGASPVPRSTPSPF